MRIMCVAPTSWAGYGRWAEPAREASGRSAGPTLRTVFQFFICINF
jgi:hypothetical protein